MNSANPNQSLGPLHLAVASWAAPIQEALQPGLIHPRDGVGVAARGGAWLTRLAEMIAVWRSRTRGRGHLMELDDRLLRDIGLTRAQAEAEWLKPFWRA